MRLTNSGRRVELRIMHWENLVEFLVTVGLLDERNVRNDPKIEEAVGDLLNFHIGELRAFQESYNYRFQLPLPEPGPNFRPCSSEPRTVGFWTDVDDAEALELEIEDMRGIRDRLEEIVFRFYSAIEDWRRPDSMGIAWGSWNYGRHRDAFLTEEEARAGQHRFEESQKMTLKDAGLEE